MHASAGAAAAAALLRRFPRLPLNSPARPVSAGGLSAYSMAMHVHSSFSEQDGSMDSQLFQASKNSVDVLWWTDHDTRMDGIGYRQVVHFTSLTKERGGPGQGRPWDWTQVTSGPLGSRSTGGIVQSPSSPSDPVAGGSMQLIAKSTTGAPATFGFYAQTHQASWNYRDNLNGQSLTIDVLLTGGWQAGYLELLIVSSYHEAIGGRPAGGYQLSYQFVPPGGTARRTANGLTGVITIPVTPNSGTDPWGTVTINPAEDIAALWPDMDYRDFGLYELTLSAVSTGDLVEGYFDYLRFNRSISGEAFLTQQADMGAALAARYRSVVQQQGLEVSLSLPHVNWFGKSVSIPDYGSTKGRREYGTIPGPEPDTEGARVRRAGQLQSPVRLRRHRRTPAGATGRHARPDRHGHAALVLGTGRAGHRPARGGLLPAPGGGPRASRGAVGHHVPQRAVLHRQRHQRRPLREELARQVEQLVQLGLGAKHRDR